MRLMVHGRNRPTLQTHVEDQYCHSLMLDMPTTLHDPEQGEALAVYVRKESGADIPYVVVRTPDDREMRLTIDEVASSRHVCTTWLG